MAYFQAIAFELGTGRSIGDCTEGELLDAYGEWPVLFYDGDGSVRVRDFDGGLDFDRLAEIACLDPVNDMVFTDPAELRIVRSCLHHGGYMDKYDRHMLDDMPELAFLEKSESVARLIHENYVAHRKAEGSTNVIEDYDKLSLDMRRSNVTAAQDIVNKVHILGYHIEREDRCDPVAVVDTLPESEVEFLAALEHRRWCQDREACGWKYAEVKSVPRRRSPYLVPYAQLSETMKEYDREPVREIVDVLAQFGFRIVRG